MNQVAMEQLPEVMSVELAAQYLGVCRATAYNKCKSGEIPSFKVGTVYRIRKAVLDQWISEQEAQSSGAGK